ncbi:hypothetical protein H2200_009235 [Cladophialophora chaetospira]|uniref:DUF3328 domain containing protein n=1 Tax=Cladophialophora chaetospira TaxID=386627 RepID=A0AA38X3Q0_9EURO|nr:hypothetical protein H2200_009235 [Cladophialophora chaetospira]
MPSTLRFRSSYPTDKDPMTVPPTPKSPHGAYTGTPIPNPSKDRLSLRLRILFGIFALAAILSFAIFECRHLLIPSADIGIIPTRSSVYWKAKSALFAAEQARKRFGPPVEEVQAVFADQDAFQITGAWGDRAWIRMFPKGDGRVNVRDPRSLGLPRSAAAVDGNGGVVADTEVYEVAVVKQLECLAFLRSTLIEYDHEMHPSAHDRAHAFHCLDHIRQALLCVADTTLEPTNYGGIAASSPPQHHVGDDPKL